MSKRYNDGEVKSQPSLADLPFEIWRTIFEYLNTQEQTTLGVVLPHVAKACLERAKFGLFVVAKEAERIFRLPDVLLQLTHLDFSNCNYCDAVLMCDVIRKCGRLKTLIVVDTCLTIPDVCEATQELMVLEELALSCKLKWWKETNLLDLNNPNFLSDSVASTLRTLYVSIVISHFSEICVLESSRSVFEFSSRCENLQSLHVDAANPRLEIADYSHHDDSSGSVHWFADRKDPVWPNLKDVFLTLHSEQLVDAMVTRFFCTKCKCLRLEEKMASLPSDMDFQVRSIYGVHVNLTMEHGLIADEVYLDDLGVVSVKPQQVRLRFCFLDEFDLEPVDLSSLKTLTVQSIPSMLDLNTPDLEILTPKNLVELCFEIHIPSLSDKLQKAVSEMKKLKLLAVTTCFFQTPNGGVCSSVQHVCVRAENDSGCDYCNRRNRVSISTNAAVMFPAVKSFTLSSTEAVLRWSAFIPSLKNLRYLDISTLSFKEDQVSTCNDLLRDLTDNLRVLKVRHAGRSTNLECLMDKYFTEALRRFIHLRYLCFDGSTELGRMLPRLDDLLDAMKAMPLLLRAHLHCSDHFAKSASDSDAEKLKVIDVVAAKLSDDLPLSIIDVSGDVLLPYMSADRLCVVESPIGRVPPLNWDDLLLV